MRSITLPLMFAMLLAGCSEDRPDTSSVAVTEEASWNDQLADVRSGLSASIRISVATVSSEQFRELGTGCEQLTTLVLDRAAVTDDDLKVLASLPQLSWLKLPSPVGDPGAKLIAQSSRLRFLNLPGGVFSDRGLAELARLERLQLLRFGSPNVTDAGLRELTRLPGLRFLHLIDVPITDAGLKHIAAIEKLESFYLDGGGPTDAGLNQLLVERPELHFHRDQQHLPGDPNADRHD